MEDVWPSGAALRGEASNRLHAALAEDCRGERCRKRHPRGVRWGSGRRSAIPAGITADASLHPFKRRQNRVFGIGPGWAWRMPADWPGGVRRGGDV